MKQFPGILNIVLLVAVGLLYYLHFSQRDSCRTAVTQKGGTAKSAVIPAGKALIAYVELDSINEKVKFIRDRKNELETEQKGIVAEYDNTMHALENEANNFRKRGNNVTQQEAEAMQAKLMQQQQVAEENRQVKGQRLAEKGAKLMEDIQGKLRVFMAEFNKDKKYTYILATGTGLDYVFYKDEALNITEEVITALNEKMAAAK